MRITGIKYPIMTTLFAIGSIGIAANKLNAQEPIKQDTFEYSNPVDKYTSEDLPEAFRDTVNLSSWTNDPEILSKAPSPKFRLKGPLHLYGGETDK